MYKRFSILCVVLGLMVCAAAQKPVADREAALAHIVATLKQQAGKDISYGFTQTKHSEMLAEDVVSHGRLTLSGSRNMRWHYSDPKDFAIVVEGDSIYTESGGVRKKLSGSSVAIAGRIAKTMSTLASGDALADGKLFDVELKEDGASYIATLTPKRRDMSRMMQQVVLTMRKTDCHVKALRLVEKHGSYTLIEFGER